MMTASNSGMAAATAVFQSLLPGDHVLVSRVLYWGVRKWLAEFAEFDININSVLGGGMQKPEDAAPPVGGEDNPF